MPATFTASGYADSARATHEGTYAVSGKFVYNGASASVSDVIYMFKIPANNYKVVDGYINGLPGADGSSTFKVGIPGADTLFSTAASLTIASNTRLIAKLPKAASLSADAEGPLFVPVIVTRSTGTSTATGSFVLTLILQREKI